MFEHATTADVGRADLLGESVHASAVAASTLLREVSGIAGIDGNDLDDADLISAIDRLERAKAACAAAQARLTAHFVESQARAATRLRAEAQACSDAGDFDGWVAARDGARDLELEPVAAETPGRHRRPSRSDRRMTLSRAGVSAQVGLARRESPSRGARLANASLALVQHLHHTLDALAAGVLNERRAEIVVRCTSHLDPELRTQVDSEVVEAGQAFGAGPRQILKDIQLPLALPTLMAGVNQVIMLALSMAVIAGLVGGGGLGNEVVSAISTLDLALGFDAGISVVILAIFLDRLTASIGSRRPGHGRFRELRDRFVRTPARTAA